MHSPESPGSGPDYVTDSVLGPDGVRAWVEVTGTAAVAVVRRPHQPEVRVPGVARPHRDGSGVVRFASSTALAVVAADGRVALVDVGDAGAVVGRARWRTFDTPGHAAGIVVAPDATRFAASFDDGTSCVVGVVDLESGEFELCSDASFAWDPAWAPDGSSLVWVEWDLPAMPWDESRLVAGTWSAAGLVRRTLLAGEMGLSQPRFANDGVLGFLLDRRLHWMSSLDDTPRAFEASEFIEHGPAPLGPGARSWAWVGDDVICTRDAFTVRVGRRGTVSTVQSGYARSIDGCGDAWIAVCDDWNVAPYLHGVETRRTDLASVVRPQWITYSSASDEIPALWWRPSAVDDDDRTPLLVEVHGGPVGGIAADWRGAQRAARWAERGWSVLIPGYRGTTGYGEALRRSLRGQWGVADVADVAAGIEALVERGRVDAARVVVSGGSAGGFTALLVAIERPDLVRAVVSTFGVADLLACADTTWRFESGYFDWLIGRRPDAEADYVARSPVTRAASLTVPLLVFQGDADIVVTPDQADRLVAAARTGGVQVEDVRFVGEGHGWKQLATTAAEAEHTEAFLRRLRIL